MRPSGPAAGWIRDLVSNGFGGRFLAGMGAIAAVLGVLQVVAPQQAADVPKVASLPLLIGAAALLAVAAAYLSRPRRAVTCTFRGPSSWNITIRRGDLFDRGSGIVVTVDRLASTALAVVGEDSLVTGLIERWFGGSAAALDAAIGLAGQPASGDGDGDGRELFPVGRLFPFARQGHRGWLLCLTEPSDAGPRTTWQDLHTAHNELWIALRKANVPRVAVPVIGSGYARAQLSLEGLLHLMLLSYHSASLTGRVTADLDIIVSERDYQPIVLTTASRLLAALGYTQR